MNRPRIDLAGVDIEALRATQRSSNQVLPPRARYVNIHPNVLHMFALLDQYATALPDFTAGTGSL